MHIVELFMAAAQAVATVVLAAVAGAWLARREVLHRQAVSDLSRVVFNLMLPCLLWSKVAVNLTPATLRAWWLLPVAAVFYAGLGLALGVLARRICAPPPDFREGLVVACGFGNSGYLPMTLVVALAATAPQFANDPGAGARGISYISVYLITFSPFLWAFGYPYLGGREAPGKQWRRAFSPPLYAMFAAIVVALVPPLKSWFCGTDAPLRSIMAAASLLGSGTIPCAMLVLGANLARPERRGSVPPRVALGVIAVRLLVLPVCGIGLTLGLGHLGWLPADPVFRLVLMLEATTPTALNLVVMCQLHRRGEQEMATVLLWEYLAATVGLAFFLSIHLYLLAN